MDVKTEAAIMEATDALMRGRLTIMVAHRLSTLKDCDMILALDHGELVDQQASVQRGQLLRMVKQPWLRR